MAEINYLTRIVFDDGAAARVGTLCGELGIGRALVVTDGGIVAAGLLGRVLEPLGATHAATFDRTPSNPTEAAVLDALAVYRAAGCDGIVAVGGGSSIDLAKAVGLLATHDGPLERYAAILGGIPRIVRPTAPLIAVPTTAGTGSEVGRAALITLSDGRKLGFISPRMIPDIALCDPALTHGLPRGLTAATGMDALTHCIETFLSPRVNPPADAIALDGAARAMAWIERAVADGGDRAARWQMMMASLQGGLCFQKGLGAVHSMSHPLGGLAAPVLHHGTLNAVILPPVLRYNAGHAGDKYARLAQAMRLPPGQGLDAAIAALNRRLGLPANLRAMGVPEAALPRMVDGAVADHSTATNPRPLQKPDFEVLFAEAMDTA
ncbi:MAG: iron-containing alcohol dehydrogenase [Alphaproteobacteria bacterium]